MTHTEKWIARYKDKDGKDGMGMADHHTVVSPLIGLILNNGGSNIVVTDETYRPRIIEGELNHEQCS